MLITCPFCQKQHRLRADFTPPPKAAANCKGCGHRFLIADSIPSLTEGQTPASDQGEVTIPPNRSNNENSVPPDRQAVEQVEEADAIAAIIDSYPSLSELPAETFALADLFSPDGHGNYRHSLNSSKQKLVMATAPLLIDKILCKGEKIHKIASGIAYFHFEIPYANGLLTWPLNYYALIATNHRLLFINMDFHLNRPDRYVFQVYLSEITKVSKGIYGTSLIVETASGQVWDFTTLKRLLAKELYEFVMERKAPFADNPPENDFDSQLCPICFEPVPERVLSCPNCHTLYKSAGEACRKSLLLPGLGTMYLTFTSLGITEMLGYLLTWLLTVTLVIIGIPGGFWGGGLLVLAYHLMSAFMAGQMARKGHIPEMQLLDPSFPDQVEDRSDLN